jgi:hypothetical protein
MPRSGEVAIWTDSEMILWGGQKDEWVNGRLESGFYSSGARYRP